MKYVKALKGCHGITYPTKRLIVIETEDTAPEFVRVVLVHELLHACFSTAAFDFKQEEKAVRALTCTLISLLRDNPSFL